LQKLANLTKAVKVANINFGTCFLVGFRSCLQLLIAVIACGFGDFGQLMVSAMCISREGLAPFARYSAKGLTPFARYSAKGLTPFARYSAKGLTPFVALCLVVYVV